MLVLLGVFTLLGLGVIGFVMWRYRIPPRGLVAMIGALVYLASPVDVLPEVILGPLGLLDDAGAATATAIFVYKLPDREEATPGRGGERPSEARASGVTVGIGNVTARSDQPAPGEPRGGAYVGDAAISAATARAPSP